MKIITAATALIMTCFSLTGCTPAVELSIGLIDALATEPVLSRKDRVFLNGKSYTDDRNSFVRKFQSRFSAPLVFDAGASDSDKLMNIYGIKHDGRAEAKLSPSEDLSLRVFGHTVCFIHKDEVDLASAAFEKCHADLKLVLESYFLNPQWVSDFRVAGVIPGTKHISHATIYSGAAAWLAEGYSPEDMGGQPSFIVSLRLILSAAPGASEEVPFGKVASALKDYKPSHMAFMIPNKIGTGNNQYGDPFGAY